MPAEIDKDKCQGSKDCLASCPTEAIKITDDGKAEVDKDACADCGACVDACPNRAIQMV